uniref:Uncharacterized protein n=1 Tax=Arundo donax TaxID=35708 RepID=A0A0A8ZPF5_ARUDO
MQVDKVVCMHLGMKSKTLPLKKLQFYSKCVTNKEQLTNSGHRIKVNDANCSQHQ